MSWLGYSFIGLAVIIIYVFWAKSRNRREARKLFQLGWDFAKSGVQATDDEIIALELKFDAFQSAAFGHGHTNGRMSDPDSNPDDEFDYDLIMRSAEQAYNDPRRKRLGLK